MVGQNLLEKLKQPRAMCVPTSPGDHKIAWRAWVPGCTSGTSSAGLGQSRADNHCHGETERNRLTLSYCVRPARATKLRFFQGLVGATLGAERTEIMPNTVQRHTPKS